MKIEAKSASIEDFKIKSSEGLIGKIYSIEIEVPSDYLEFQSVGPIMAYHACQTQLYDFILGSRGGNINSIKKGGSANIAVEIGESYAEISLRDFQKIPSAYLVLEEDKSN